MPDDVTTENPPIIGTPVSGPDTFVTTNTRGIQVEYGSSDTLDIVTGSFGKDGEVAIFVLVSREDMGLYMQLPMSDGDKLIEVLVTALERAREMEAKRKAN